MSNYANDAAPRGEDWFRPEDLYEVWVHEAFESRWRRYAGYSDEGQAEDGAEQARIAGYRKVEILHFRQVGFRRVPEGQEGTVQSGDNTDRPPWEAAA